MRIDDELQPGNFVVEAVELVELSKKLRGGVFGHREPWQLVDDLCVKVRAECAYIYRHNARDTKSEAEWM
jgi:hypothetical protein